MATPVGHVVLRSKRGDDFSETAAGFGRGGGPDVPLRSAASIGLQRMGSGRVLGATLPRDIFPFRA